MTLWFDSLPVMSSRVVKNTLHLLRSLDDYDCDTGNFCFTGACLAQVGLGIPCLAVRHVLETWTFAGSNDSTLLDTRLARQQVLNIVGHTAVLLKQMLCLAIGHL